MFKKISTAFLLSIVVTASTAMILTSIPNIVAVMAGTLDNTQVSTIRGTDGADLSTLTAIKANNGQIRVNQDSVLKIDTASVQLAPATVIATGNSKALNTNTLILRPEPIANPATIAAIKFGSETQHLTFTKAVKINLAVNPAFNDKVVNVKVKHEGQSEFNTSGLQDASGQAQSKFKVANNSVEFYSVGASTFIVNLDEPVSVPLLAIPTPTPEEIKTKIPATVIPLKTIEIPIVEEVIPNSITKVLATEDICITSPNDLSCPTGDSDSDGSINSVDPYPSNACLPSSSSPSCDLDKDRIPNSSDTDDDGDGSNDTNETGDINGDGIADAYQVSVVSLVDGEGVKQTLIFDGEGECGIPLGVYNIPESQLKKQDPKQDYPQGFNGFKVKCSGTTTVTNLFPGADKNEIGKMIKAGNTVPGDDSTFAFYEFPKYDVQINGHYGYQFYVTDGEKGDDTGKDGMIVDPYLNTNLLQIVSIVKAFVNPVTYYDENTDLSYTITVTNKGTNPVLGLKITDDLFGGDPNIQVTACDKAFVAPNFSTIDLKLRRELQNTNDVYVITCKAKAQKAGTVSIKNTIKLAINPNFFETVAPEAPLKQSDGKSSTMEEAAEDSITALPKPVIVVPPPTPIPTPVPTPVPTPIPTPAPSTCCNSCCNSSCCASGMNYNSIDNKNNIVIKDDAWGYLPVYNMNNIFGSDFGNKAGDVKFTFKPVTNNFYK
jgi:hypothetical protein